MALSNEVLNELTNAYGEIKANFTITQIPLGGAPEHIKKEWLGVTLPVRSSKLGAKALDACLYFDALTLTVIENTEPVAIEGVEAIDALEEAKKIEAVEFWLPYRLAPFVFRANEGDLVPVDTH